MKGKTNLIFCFIAFSILISFTKAATTESELKTYLDEKEKQFEEISVQMGTANWNLYSQEAESDQDTPKQRFFELYNDEKLIETIDSWFKKKDGIKDFVLKRRVEVWNNVLTGARVDFDETIFELENQLEAWMANDESVDKPEPEEIEKMILHLMKLRNEKAKELGYENCAYMILQLQGYDVDWFYKVAEKIDKYSSGPYNKIIEDYKKKNEKSKFDANGLRSAIGKYFGATRATSFSKEEKMDLMKETMANIGINYDALPVRFVEKEIPYGGNGLGVEIPNDFRIVVNNGTGLSTWMHELGHGLHAVFTEIENPILKGYEWCLGNSCHAFGEGMAETSAFFVRNNNWMKKYLSLSDKEIIKMEKEKNKYLSAYLRYRLFTYMFEIELYKNLDQDTNKLYKDLQVKYFLIDPESATDLSISNNIMFVSYPVYLQNYVFGEIIANQVHSYLKDKYGKEYLFNKEVGQFIIDNLYKDGELFSWQEKLKNATGKEFDVDGYFNSKGYRIN